MDILSAADVLDIQTQIAPAYGDAMSEVFEVWRKPGTPLGSTPPAGGIGVGSLGMPIEEGSDAARPDQKRVQVAQYPGQIVGGWQGTETEFAGQVVDASRYTIFFNAGDEPDIRGGDRLDMKRTVWTPYRAVAVGDEVQPVASNGRCYRATVAGVTGAVEPVWPKATFGQTVQDGSVTWMYAGYLRTFEVKVPGGEVTYEVLRRVLVEEITN